MKPKKPHHRKSNIQLVVGDGEIEFRTKDQKAWPKRPSDVFILSYRMMLDSHVHGQKNLEFGTYEEAWDEARTLGVRLFDWPLWLRGIPTHKVSTRRGVVDLPLNETVADLDPKRYRRNKAARNV